ncbi:Tripartite tricarboxylate transporter family receptor [compost metagenome]
MIKRLNAAINEALKQPDVRQRFAASSVETIGSTPAECGSYIKAEIKRWGEVARAANIRIE